MIEALPTSHPGVADVIVLAGARAPAGAPPTLLVEAPHGATLPAHYEQLRAQLRSRLPDDLHEFFFVNTDVGSWEYGLRVAERVLDNLPDQTAMVIRCLIPRTFVDTNRRVDGGGGALGRGELTAAMPPFVDDPADHALLHALHRAYFTLVARAYAAICGRGGLALIPHTYGPRTLGIERVDVDIVAQLRAAHAPGIVERWPLRAEIDLLTRTPEGEELAPPGIADELRSAYAVIGLTALQNHTYNLHPASVGHDWSRRYPGRVLCLEVRRDLIVERWRWNEAMRADPAAIDRVARPLAEALTSRLTR
ncbi:MAG: hypothetical protein R3A51_10210 [Nannocystaceae bacterium]